MWISLTLIKIEQPPWNMFDFIFYSFSKKTSRYSLSGCYQITANFETDHRLANVARYYYETIKILCNQITTWELLVYCLILEIPLIGVSLPVAIYRFAVWLQSLFYSKLACCLWVNGLPFDSRKLLENFLVATTVKALVSSFLKV